MDADLGGSSLHPLQHLAEQGLALGKGHGRQTAPHALGQGVQAVEQLLCGGRVLLRAVELVPFLLPLLLAESQSREAGL